MNRRTFLATSSALVVLPAIGGCTGGGAVLSNDLDVKLSDHPDLATVGKTVLIDAGLGLPIAITLTGPGTYAITSTECTHQGCEVNRDSIGWTCPCHGSQFTLEGDVRRGPAQDPLPMYDYVVSGDVLTIKGMG
jgi:Rieske Fe-S protein